MLKLVHDGSDSNANGVAALGASLLDKIFRDGARQMLAAALQAEVAAYIESCGHEVDEDGHRLVVRNGYHAEREVTTAAGAVKVRQPRVNDKRGSEPGAPSPTRTALGRRPWCALAGRCSWWIADVECYSVRRHSA